jgi:hypothetical protein
MSSELPKIRTQLKNKIPTIVKEGDKVSLIWFSSKGQYGTLAEKIEINSLTDLSYLNTAIDRWLKPVGMTGFVEPLQSAVSLAGTCDDEPVSLFFLTDGCDNQWDTDVILKTAGHVGSCVSSAVIVEYGWYCNRSLLTQMAEKMEASLVFCEDFDKYDPVMSNVLSKSLNSIKKVTLNVGKPNFGIVFSVSSDGPVTYTVTNGTVDVPQSVDAVYFYSDDLKGDVFDSETQAVLQSIVLLSRKMESAFIKRVLARMQYVQLFNKFSTAYGKQNMTDFQVLCTELSNNLEKLNDFDKSTDLKVDPNAFTVLDLLFIMAKDKGNLLMVDDMKYRRIGRGREDASGKVSDDELKQLQEALANVKDKAGLDELKAKIASIESDKAPKLTFVADESEGYPIANLVWNEFRPNLSILVKKSGTVELPADKAKEFGLPQKFPTFIYRNYTIIADGIVNVAILPVKLTADTAKEIAGKWLGIKKWFKGKAGEHGLPIRDLPTLNEGMINKVSAKNFINLNYEKCQLKAQEKVIKYFKERWFGKKTSNFFLEKYGESAVNYLKELGITDYSGFSPKMVVAEKTGDFYMSVELSSAIPSLSKVPSMNEYLKALEATKKNGKKLTIAMSLFVDAHAKALKIETDAKFVEGKEVTEAMAKALNDGIAVWEQLIDDRLTAIQHECTEILFSIVVGQTWFSEFSSLSENTVEVKLNGEPVQCQVQLKDEKVEL